MQQTGGRFHNLLNIQRSRKKERIHHDAFVGLVACRIHEVYFKGQGREEEKEEEKEEGFESGEMS